LKSIVSCSAFGSLSFLNQSCFSASSDDSLCSESFSSNLLSKSLQTSDTAANSFVSRLTGCVLIFFYKLFKSLPLKGKSPTKITYNIIPKLHISNFWLYGSFLSASGGI